MIRYFTASSASAYLVAMPKTPVSHIQSTAPGPPAATAVATPTMLPVPIVAASAVVSAPNWLTSPSPSAERWNERRIARAEVALDEAQPDRQEEVRAEEQHQQRRAPDDVADASQHRLELAHGTSAGKHSPGGSSRVGFGGCLPLRFFLVAGSAPAVDRAAAAAVLKGLVADGEPGLAVLVRRNGRTILERAYGVRDLRTRRRSTRGRASGSPR